MIKYKLYFDKDKETAWINEMAEKGWALNGFCMGFYSFRPCEPGKYIYQVDFTSGMFTVSEDYREFMKEAGVEIVCLWGPWVILRREASEGPFELYTDVESTIEHYTKILKMFKGVAILEVICFFVELYGACRGSRLALAFLFIIGAFAFVVLKEVVHIKQMLAELKSRQGEAVETGWFGKRRVSTLLPIGMLFNSISLMMEESIHPYIRYTVSAIAIVLMLIGLILTAQKKED